MKRSFAAALIAAFVATGCVGTQTTRSYTITQRGLTPGSSGPRAFGPALGAGGFGLSVSALGALRGAAEGKRDAGAAGDISADKAARFAIAAGLNDIAELGFTIEVRPGSLGKNLASDVAASSFEDETLIIPGLETRLAFAATETTRAGLIVEMGVAGIPYHRDVDVSVVTTTTRFDGTRTQSSHTEHSAVSDDAYRVMVRAGPYGTHKFGGVFSVTGGALFGNQPTLAGVLRSEESCFRPEQSFESRCSGENEDEVSAVHDVLAITPFASASIELGSHVAIAGQLFATFFTGDSLSGAPTGGGELAIVVMP